MRPVTCLVTYEEYPTKGEPIYAPKCYCILTNKPTGEFAHRWLQHFNESYPRATAASPSDWESTVDKLLGTTEGDISSTDGVPAFGPPGSLPPCDANAFWLIHSIGLGNVVKVVLWLLQEEKVIFVSSSLPLLSQCINTVSALLYPFAWSFMYITVLPVSLIEYTQSPMPFLVGLLRSAFTSVKPKEIPEGAMIIDLDYGTVMGNTAFTIMPPPHLTRQLFADLQYAGEAALGLDNPLAWGAAGAGIPGERLVLHHTLVRAAFLRFFAALVQGHRRYVMYLRLLPKPHAHFSSGAFIQSFAEDARNFAEALIRKQMFLAFIETRPWPVGDAFDTAVAREVWKMPMEEMPAFINTLADGTAERPVFGLTTGETQMRVDEGLTEEARCAFDKAIEISVPAIVNFRVDTLETLKKSINVQYFRIRFCTVLREYLHREGHRAWEVSENAGRLIGDLLSFMITESEARSDYVSLKLIAGILHKCHYKRGSETHYLCERSASAQAWKTTTVWEEIFCIIMTSVLESIYMDVPITKDWDKLPKDVVTQYANREWEETRLEFAFLVSMMESLDVSPVIMKKLMPVVIVNFDENKYQELIGLLEPTTMAKLQEVDSLEKHSLPQNIAAANIVVCWVDDKINEPTLIANVKAVQDEIQRLKKNINLEIQSNYSSCCFIFFEFICLFYIAFPSSKDLKDWLCTYGHKLEDKLRIVTNRYRQFDGCDNAAEAVFRVVREDAKLPSVPVLIFCGNKPLAESIVKKQQNGYVAVNIVSLCDFCINGKLPK